MKNVFGGLMMGCGILIAGTAGGCAMIILVFFPDTKITLEGISFFGPPIAIGLGLLGVGAWMIFGMGKTGEPPAPGQGNPALPADQVRPAAPPRDADQGPGSVE